MATPTAPDYHEYMKATVPDGPTTFVPCKAVGAGASWGAVPSHKCHEILVMNTAGADLIVGWTKAAAEAGFGWKLLPGWTLRVRRAQAVRRVVVACNGAAAGEAQAAFDESRQPVNDGHPELTVAKGFPQYDEADSDNIVPGVST